MWSNPQETADLLTFTEKILNGKFRFLCSDWIGWWHWSIIEFSIIFVCSWFINIVFSKKLLDFSATFVSLERSFPFSINDILVWAVTLSPKNGLMVLQNSLFQLYYLRVIYCNIFSFVFCKVHYRNCFLSYMPSNWCLLFFKYLFYNSVHFKIASLTILVKMVLTKYKIWEAIKGAVTDMRYFARNKFSRS